MRIHGSRHDGFYVVASESLALPGHGEQLYDFLLDLLEKGERAVAIDLTGVRTLESLMIVAIVNLALQLKKLDGRFAVVGANDYVAGTLLRFHPGMKGLLFDSLEAAEEGLEKKRRQS